MTRARLAVWLPLVFVPLAAWSKDTAVIALILAAAAMLAAGTRPSLCWPMIGLAVWAAVAMLWAPEPAWTNWLQSWIVISAAAILVGGIETRTFRPPTTPVVYAVVALFGILLVERVTGGGVIGLVRTTDTTDRLFNVLSAGLAFLCCLTFPAAALIARTYKLPAAAIFAAAVFALAVSYHMDAAPAALAVGAIAFAAVYLGGRRVLFAGAVVAALVAMLWGVAAELAVARGAADWLNAHVDVNWGLRVQIWARVATLIGEHPFIGLGFEAGRMVGRPDVTGAPVPVPFMHPHNGMLQVWLELGVVGVALLLAWGALAVRRLAVLAANKSALATAAATLATTSVFWLVSFGLWAGWWLAALGLIAAALVLALRSDARAVVPHPGLEHQNTP